MREGSDWAGFKSGTPGVTALILAFGTTLPEPRHSTKRGVAVAAGLSLGKIFLAFKTTLPEPRHIAERETAKVAGLSLGKIFLDFKTSRPGALAISSISIAG
jgi:hypothetical protein